MDGTRKCLPEWGNAITREHTWYALPDQWILAQNLGIPTIQFTDSVKLKRKEHQSVDTVILLEGGSKCPWGEIQRQIVEQRLRERPFRDCHTWSPSHIQLLNPDTIVDANKCLLTGVWYSCPLRGSASAWQIQKWMLTANQWTEHRDPNGGSRERTQEAIGVCSLRGGTIWTTQ